MLDNKQIQLCSLLPLFSRLGTWRSETKQLPNTKGVIISFGQCNWLDVRHPRRTFITMSQCCQWQSRCLRLMLEWQKWSQQCCNPTMATEHCLLMMPFKAIDMLVCAVNKTQVSKFWKWLTFSRQTFHSWIRKKDDPYLDICVFKWTYGLSSYVSKKNEQVQWVRSVQVRLMLNQGSLARLLVCKLLAFGKWYEAHSILARKEFLMFISLFSYCESSLDFAPIPTSYDSVFVLFCTELLLCSILVP